MKVCVTGGAGFIGHNLVEQLLNKNYQVLVLDDLSTGNIENVPKKSEFVKVDLAREPLDGLIDIMKDCKIVFHTAAKARVQPSIVNPIEYDTVNVHATLNVLFASYKVGVNRFIFSSSSSVYGQTDVFPTNEDVDVNPTSPYALQKYFGEMYCRLFSKTYGLDTVVLRYFNVYGKGMIDGGAYSTVLNIFKNQKKNNLPLSITNDGNQRRDFTHVDDVVRANILCAENRNNFNGEIFNVGNGNNFSINEISDVFGCEKIYNKTVLEPFQTLCDNKKIKNHLGWQPTGNVIEWVKNNL